jgi:hypothetical protein
MNYEGSSDWTCQWRKRTAEYASQTSQTSQTESNRIKQNQTCEGGGVTENWLGGGEKEGATTARSKLVKLSQTQSNRVKPGQTHYPDRYAYVNSNSV